MKANKRKNYVIMSGCNAPTPSKIEVVFTTKEKIKSRFATESFDGNRWFVAYEITNPRRNWRGRIDRRCWIDGVFASPDATWELPAYFELSERLGIDPITLEGSPVWVDDLHYFPAAM